mmetsp:Transcript_5853/g.8968  ORF Transcript_5853/g.8968 Transcript_5853/m.8968 type:complete len:113 (-) Transcript_5853:67-405(-)
MQAESFHFPSELDGISSWRKQALELGFVNVKYGTLTITSYIGGQIGFLLMRTSNDESSCKKHVKARFDAMVEAGKTTSYYHPRLQTSAFDLPLWVENSIYGEEREQMLEGEE